MGHLQLDRLLSADGVLLDGILAAGASILLGGGGGVGGFKRPTVIQRVPKSKDFDRPPAQRQSRPENRGKIIRMSMMGRPVRTMCPGLLPYPFEPIPYTNTFSSDRLLLTTSFAVIHLILSSLHSRTPREGVFFFFANCIHRVTQFTT